MNKTSSEVKFYTEHYTMLYDIRNLKEQVRRLTEIVQIVAPKSTFERIMNG